MEVVFINEEAVIKIMNYIYSHCFEPDVKFPTAWFDQMSYSNWAAYEILELVMDHPLDDPSLLIDEFIIKMELFTLVGGPFEKGIIFSIAKDTAEDIQLLFI